MLKTRRQRSFWARIKLSMIISIPRRVMITISVQPSFSVFAELIDLSFQKNLKNIKNSRLHYWLFLRGVVYSFSPSQHSDAVLWQIREGNNWLNNFFSVFTIKNTTRETDTQRVIPNLFRNLVSIVNQFSKYFKLALNNLWRSLPFGVLK